MHLSIKGDLKTVQITELLQFQDLEGFYIREVYLTNGRPSWHHERLSWLALWFDYESGNWMVGSFNEKQHFALQILWIKLYNYSNAMEKWSVHLEFDGC